MANRVGQQFGDYCLIKFLGNGTNGDVYLGQNIHAHGDAPVAVKVLKTPLTNENIEEVVNEAGICRLLRHEHIIRLHEIGLTGDHIPFLIMDYAPKGSLRSQHPKGSRLSLGIIVSYVKSIASALQYAHDRSLIHRDIKPENILLGEHNEVLVSDFGTAVISFTKNYDERLNITGTLPYMAPEQFKGEAQSASDQYSLAVVVYEWLCGAWPFNGRKFEEFAWQHLEVPPPSLREKVPGISPEVEQMVLRALAKDPQQRFPSILEFANALEQALLPPRKIALFGYETDGGRNSPLWNNPQMYFSDAQYAAKYATWSKTKRDFTEEEILNGIWVKASEHGHARKVRFLTKGDLPKGDLIESDLFDPGTQWNGWWSLLDGVLRVNIGDYELDIFANHDSSLHSGIEFKKGQSTPWSYFAVFHTQALSAKQWDMSDVPALIHQIYGQILHRRADESGLITYGAQLHRGEKSVKEIMRILGHSLEYRREFVDPFMNANLAEVALELCYERFLGRNADDLGRSEHAKVVQKMQGFDAVIDALTDSEEYKKSFGEDDVPPTTVGLAVASRWPNHLECFYRDRDNHLQNRWWYGSGWSEEGSLGGTLTSAPAAISWGKDRLDCFYRGQDGHLCHRWWDDGSVWSAEEDLGGSLTSALAVASFGPNHLDCFYRDQQNHLCHRWWDGSAWSHEDNLGGTLVSAPAVVSWGPNRVDCFYRDQQNHLCHRWWDGSGWIAEENLGGILA